MVSAPRPAELSGLFLRYCLNWQRLTQVTVLVSGALLLLVYGAIITGLSGYVWLLCLLAAYAASYWRDAPLHMPRQASTANVRHAFNLLALAAGVILRLSALVSVMIWAIGEDMTHVAGYAGRVVLFVALVEMATDMLFVEGARAFIVLTGQEAVFLTALWSSGVQHSPQDTADAGFLAPRRFFTVTQNNGSPPAHVGMREPEIILDE
jgi:hypothetical protein